jgi:glyoxylase-like metal-dependent hydrolase (beta-lactamase superfamily II)
VYNKLMPVINLIETMIQVFPKVILLYPDRDRREIILIDPIGREIPDKELMGWSAPQREYFIAHQHLLKPNYAEILKQFISRVTGYEADLKSYKIRIMISHAHPDHWTGLSTLIADPRIFEVGARPEVLLLKEVLESIQNYTLGYRIPDLKANCDPRFVQDIARVINLFYGDATAYQGPFREGVEDRPIQLRIITAPDWRSGRCINWDALRIRGNSGGGVEVIHTPQFEWAFPRKVHSEASVIFKYTPSNLRRRS